MTLSFYNNDVVNNNTIGEKWSWLELHEAWLNENFFRLLFAFSYCSLSVLFFIQNFLPPKKNLQQKCKQQRNRINVFLYNDRFPRRQKEQNMTRAYSKNTFFFCSCPTKLPKDYSPSPCELRWYFHGRRNVTWRIGAAAWAGFLGDKSEGKMSNKWHARKICKLVFCNFIVHFINPRFWIWMSMNVDEGQIYWCSTKILCSCLSQGTC